MLAQTVAVILDDRLITLDRAVGVVRRRNLPVRNLAVAPTVTPGIARLTIMMQTDPATAERLALHFRKIVGVHGAIAFPAGDGVARELALVRVRVARGRYAEFLDVIQLFGGALVEEGADESVVELTGSEAFVLSGLRAFERFGVLAVARSGSVALEPAAVDSPLPSTPEA